jgi:hypothetical protein
LWFVVLERAHGRIEFDVFVVDILCECATKGGDYWVFIVFAVKV